MATKRAGGEPPCAYHLTLESAHSKPLAVPPLPLMQTTSWLHTWGGWVYDLAVDLLICVIHSPDGVAEKENPATPGRVRGVFGTSPDKPHRMPIQ